MFYLCIYCCIYLYLYLYEIVEDVGYTILDDNVLIGYNGNDFLIYYYGYNNIDGDRDGDWDNLIFYYGYYLNYIYYYLLIFDWWYKIGYYILILVCIVDGLGNLCNYCIGLYYVYINGYDGYCGYDGYDGYDDNIYDYILCILFDDIIGRGWWIG